MKEPMLVLMEPDDRGGQRKVAILCDRLVWRGIKHTYEKVGKCHRVMVEAEDAVRAMEPEHA